MAKPKQPKPNQAVNRDQKIIETNSYLELQKEHKKWYSAEGMGKQRGKPKAISSNIKKEKGSRKHSLRKER